MIKKAVKYILYRFIGKPLYLMLKPFYHPSEKMRRRLRFIGRFRVRAADGKRFYLFNNAFHLENHIFWLGIDRYPWERMTRCIWARLCPSSQTILDIGANSGIYAVLAKVYNRDSQVYAFEPQPNVFDVLMKNNRVNGFDIHCEKLALSSREGRLPFYNYGPDTFTTENTTAGSLNENWVKRDQQSILVDVKRLDNFIREENIPGVDLMKIDVETLEYDVLLGYGEYLEKHRPAIVLEIQDREIGQKLESLLGFPCTWFNIHEERGLIEVTELGKPKQGSSAAGTEPENPRKNLNYLLCPPSRIEHIREFIQAH